VRDFRRPDFKASLNKLSISYWCTEGASIPGYIRPSGFYADAAYAMYFMETTMSFEDGMVHVYKSATSARSVSNFASCPG
jgi:hypothetical protein